MNAIVSVTRDWGIGLDGRLVVRNRDDMRFFRKMTLHGTVVMGRKTYESLPNGPLADRENVVVTHSTERLAPGVVSVGSVDEAMAHVMDKDPDHVWVIGGESIYHQMLDECAFAYVTLNQNECACDAFFPDLENDEGWSRDRVCSFGVNEDGFHYVTYMYRNRAHVRHPLWQDWKSELIGLARPRLATPAMGGSYA